MTTVREVFAGAGLVPQGCVKWGTPVPLGTPGVYVVATTDDLDTSPAPASCPLDVAALRSLLERRPEVAVDGRPATEQSLSSRLSSMWMASEPVLYIGLAGTSLSMRVDQYYRTPLGARSPHAGGWPIKMLSNLRELWIHYASSEDPDRSEINMMSAFLTGVPSDVASVLCDSATAVPYANLMIPAGRKKRHGITGAKADRISSTARSASATSMRNVSQPATQSGNAERVDTINHEIQRRLRNHTDRFVTAVEAAVWLDTAGLLKDSAIRPGLPLRNLLRAGRIVGQRQDSNSRWFIDLRA